MTKKASSQPENKQPPAPNRPRGLWAAVAMAILLIAGGVVMLWPQPAPAPIPALAPATGAAPKAVVEQTEIDAGYQPYGTLIETTFKIRNEGEGPLQLAANPKVKLVEGC